MSNAVADMELQPAAPRNALGAGLARLDKTQKIRLGLGVLALLAIALSVFFMGRQPDWRILYTSLSDKDGGAIVAQLTQMNVPYKQPRVAAPSWCRPTACTMYAFAWPRKACPRARWWVTN